MSWATPQTWVNGEPVGAYDMIHDVANNAQHLFYDAGPGRVMLFHDESTVTAGNAITTVTDTAQVHNVVSYQNAAALSDQFTQSFVLGPGTYQLEIWGRGKTDGGQLDIALNGSDFVPGWICDFYRAGTMNNVQIIVASFSITSFGRHVFTYTVNGKNASSSGYRIEISEMWIKVIWTAGDI